METKVARELTGKKEVQEVRDVFKTMSGKNMTLSLFLKFILFLGCDTHWQDHRWDTSDNIDTTIIAGDYRECRDHCSEWVGKNNELCEFWQWRRGGTRSKNYCNFKRGTLSDCRQPDRVLATGQFSGRCPPPSSSTCDEGIRYGRSLIQTFQK